MQRIKRKWQLYRDLHAEVRDLRELTAETLAAIGSVASQGHDIIVQGPHAREPYDEHTYIRNLKRYFTGHHTVYEAALPKRPIALPGATTAQYIIYAHATTRRRRHTYDNALTFGQRTVTLPGQTKHVVMRTTDEYPPYLTDAYQLETSTGNCEHPKLHRAIAHPFVRLSRAIAAHPHYHQSLNDLRDAHASVYTDELATAAVIANGLAATHGASIDTDNLTALMHTWQHEIRATSEGAMWTRFTRLLPSESRPC